MARRRLADHINDALVQSAQRVLTAHPDHPELRAELDAWLATAHEHLTIAACVDRRADGRIDTRSYRLDIYLTTTAGPAPLLSVRRREVNRVCRALKDVGAIEAHYHPTNRAEKAYAVVLEPADPGCKTHHASATTRGADRITGRGADRITGRGADRTPSGVQNAPPHIEEPEEPPEDLPKEPAHPVGDQPQDRTREANDEDDSRSEFRAARQRMRGA